MNPILILTLLSIFDIKETNNICDNCLTIVEDILDFIEDKNNQETIEELLRVLCYILPKEETNLCLTMVDKYMDKIFEELTSHTALEYCSTIGLCKNEFIELECN